MQAIVTKYHGPGNTRGSCITARCAAGSIRFGYDHGLDLIDNHRAAAAALAVKLGWTGPAYGSLVAGSLPDGSFAHVSTVER